MVWELLMEALGDKINIYVIITILVGIIMTAKLDMCQDKLKIKIPIIYILFYLFAITNIVSKKILLALFIVYTFVFLEYIFIDNFTRRCVKNLWFNIFDYLYKIFFEYKFLLFFTSLFLIRIERSGYLLDVVVMVITVLILTRKFWQKYNSIMVASFGISIIILLIYLLANNINAFNIIITFISAIILFKAILSIMNNEFEAISFEKVFDKMNKIKYIYQFEPSKKFDKFAKMLVAKEDKSYFKRTKSYNWISLQFIVYRLKRLYDNFLITQETEVKNKLHEKLQFIRFIFNKLNLHMKSFFKNKKNIFINICIKGKNIKRYFRGYSTIEMQLIRTLAIQDGYEKHIFQRKVFEFIYSKVYFESLRNYYEYYVYPNAHKFKDYLLFLYINVAPVYIYGKHYKNIFDLYNKKCLDDITIEEFYIWTLGISNTPINYVNKECIIAYQMDENKINKIIEQFSQR